MDSECWRSSGAEKMDAYRVKCLKCKLTVGSFTGAVNLILLILVCGAESQFPCRPEQIHWQNGTGQKYRCLDCPACPEGSQPSVPCGTTVSYGTAVHCISCELGKTFSSNYDKAQCSTCRVCPEGKTVVKNCTLSLNTKCSGKCKQGQYFDDFVFRCWTCSVCCNDSKDELAAECASQKKKCKVRSTPCASMQATISETTTPTRYPRTTAHSSLSQTVPRDRLQTTTHLPKRKNLLTNGDSLPSPSPSSDVSMSAVNAINKKADKNGKLLKVFVVIGSLILVVFFVALFTRVWKSGAVKNLMASSSMCMPDVTEARQRQAAEEEPVGSCQQIMNGNITLHQFEERDQEKFDTMCTMLENGKRGVRRDFERLASMYPKITLENRRSLTTEFQSGGSASRLLMSHLQTLYPALTLRGLVSSLEAIGRYDIANYLSAPSQVRNGI